MTVTRTILAAMAAVVPTWSEAHAQQPASSGAQPPDAFGLNINIAPYLWLPTINANLNYNLPASLGGTLPTDISSSPGEYLSHLHFAAAFAADIQYQRFSVLTDYMYLNGGVGSTHINSLDFFGHPSQPISRSLEIGTSSNLKTTLWTLAGGYTVARGDWGNFDLLAGVRLLGVYASTDYNLALNVVGPRGNGATFGGMGGLSGSANIWNGIGGFRGRIRPPVDGLFIPYYFDIGAGGSNLTWQISSGIGYQTGWAAASVQYRYLSFEQGSGSFVKHLGMGGPMLMVSSSF